MGLHLRSRRLQSGEVAEAPGGLGVKAPANCRLIGRWRIVEADLWDRAHLDLSGPATLTITAQGGEIAFGALEAGLEVEYARNSIGFHWAGCEEGDEVEGEGTGELLDDGTIEIEFAYRNGDEAVLKAKRDPSSTTCYCRSHLRARRRVFSELRLSSALAKRSTVPDMASGARAASMTRWAAPRMPARSSERARKIPSPSSASGKLRR